MENTFFITHDSAVSARKRLGGKIYSRAKHGNRFNDLLTDRFCRTDENDTLSWEAFSRICASGKYFLLPEGGVHE